MGYHHRRTISMSDEETRMQSLPGDRAMRRSGAMVLHAVVLLVSTLVQVNRSSSQELSTRAPGSKAENQWRGVHIMSPGRDGLPLLKRAIAEKLAPMGVNTLIVIDELIDAFGADAFHVGMDEVFLMAHPSCTRCKGKDPAELFAKSVNDLHKHIVDERGLTMLMWADRLLDDKKFGYGEWEASKNGTGPAIDMIPKDIIMCDWHYEKRPEGYPSVVYLQEKGFRMLPSTWRSQDAALAMLREARTKATPKMLGHLCTTWVGAQGFCRALLDEPPPEDTKPKADAKAKRQRGPGDIVAALKTCMEELTRVEAPTK
jgi:Glycosyl hydrolase family 20, catalytic domain